MQELGKRVNIKDKDLINKLSHGGVIGSAHPSTILELQEVERVKMVPGKLAHGGVIGTAHPAAIDEISLPELKEKKAKK